MTVEEQLVEDFKLNLSFTDSPKPLRPIRPVRMMLNGHYLILGQQKKTLWKRIGDAKSALRNHSGFEYKLLDHRGKYKDTWKDYKERREIAEKAFQLLLGQITFVEVDNVK